MIEQIEQYFGLDVKGFGYLSGLLIGATIVVTLVYWLVFGFDRWTGEMNRASNLMMAAVTAPAGQTYAAPFTAPGGQTYAAPFTAQGGQTYAAPSTAGQYVCQRDGAVGLPRFDANGVPHCPIDGQVMSFVSTRSGGLVPAAAPG